MRAPVPVVYFCRNSFSNLNERSKRGSSACAKNANGSRSNGHHNSFGMETLEVPLLAVGQPADRGLPRAGKTSILARIKAINPGTLLIGKGSTLAVGAATITGVIVGVTKAAVTTAVAPPIALRMIFRWLQPQKRVQMLLGLYRTSRCGRESKRMSRQ